MTAYFPFRIQLVFLLLVWCFHHDVERILRLFVNSHARICVHELVTFFCHRIDAKLALGDRERERPVVGFHQYCGASLDGDSGTFQALSGNELAVHHTTSGLHEALLSLGETKEAER